MTQHFLSAHDLSAGYGDRLIMQGLDLEIPSGQITAIVGANACGKSTLLRTMSRLLKPSAGQVLLDGRSVHAMPARQLAQTLGLLPQTPVAPEGITVADLVGRGRHPHHGQRQRVWIAMALAQQTDLLLLDEPTTYLDICHQIEVLDLLVDLNRTRGTTVVMVLHDLNLAARYADHLVAMCKGAIHATGTPDQVLTQEMVRSVFGMDSMVISDPASDRPLMLPLGRHGLVQPTAKSA